MDNSSQQCAYCGSPIPSGSRYCEACGQPVGPAQPMTPGPYSTVPPQQTQPAAQPQPPVQPQTPRSTPPTRAAAQTPPPYTPPAQPVNQAAYVPPVPPQKKSRSGLWACGIIAVILLCVGIVAVVMLLVFNIAQPGRPSTLSTVGVTMEAVLPQSTQQPPVEATLPQVQSSPTPVPPTARPTVENTPVPAAPAYPQIAFGNVSFQLNPDIAGSVISTRVPESLPTNDGPYWDVYPEYIEFKFQDYTLSGTFHQAAIMVYPADKYRSMTESAGDVIDSLKNFLATKPNNVAYDTSMPFLPFWNAGQVMVSNVGYVDFKNGSGIRYLTQYGQDVSPINNSSLFYTFQGLTKDGKYYIAAIMPIQHPSLPANSDNPPGGWEEFAKNYQTHVSEAVDLLNKSKSTDFTPTLDSLDELFETISIQ